MKGITFHERLRRTLSKAEDRRGYVYQDSKGYWTIGVGHLVDIRTRGRLPEVIIDKLLDYDIDEKTREITARHPWIDFIEPARRAIFIEMAFNLGAEGFFNFKKMLAAARVGDWETAAKECYDPDYIKDIGEPRARRMAIQLRTGKYEDADSAGTV